MDKHTFFGLVSIGIIIGLTLFVLVADAVAGTLDGWNLLQVAWLIYATYVLTNIYNREVSR